MRLLLSGLLLVTTGAVLPFLMATRIIEPSFPLAFLSYASSLSGLALGIGFWCHARAVTILSFLGVGVPADTVTWGSILNEARSNTFAWWLAVFRGAVIFVAVISYYMVGEGMCDALDPRLK